MNIAVVAAIFGVVVGAALGGYIGYLVEKPAKSDASAATQVDNAFKLGWVAAKCQDRANGTMAELCRGVWE